MPISELKLTKELIRRPSVTPKDAGAINILAKNLRSLGFKCQLINFKNIKNLYAKLGNDLPSFAYKFLTFLKFIIWHLKPRDLKFFAKRFIVPASFGVMLGRRINSFANFSSLIGMIF